MNKQLITLAMLMLAAGDTYAGQSEDKQKDGSQENAITLQTISVIAEKTDAANVGQSTLDQDQIATRQANTVQELVDTLPGTVMEGSPRTGGQSINIQGFGGLDVEHVQMYLDGAPKKFRKYRQGTLFLEPELLKTVDVEKGAHSSRRGNGGFGGAVMMETKGAKDLLEKGQTIGGMVKTGFHSNNNAEIYSGTVYAAGDENPFDVLVNITKRRADNMQDGDGNTFNYSGMNFLSGMAKLGYDFQNGHTVSLTQINGSDASRAPFAAKRGLFDDYEGNTLFRKTVWRETEDSNTIFKHEYTSPSLDWLNSNFTLSYTKTKQHDKRPDDVTDVTAGNLGTENWTTFNMWFAELTNNQFFETSLFSHDVLYGIQFQQEKQETLTYAAYRDENGDNQHGTFQPYYMPDGIQTTWSGFIENAISWGDWTVTPVLRYDHITNKGVENILSKYNNPDVGHDYSEQSYSSFAPKLSVFYKLTPETSLFANYSYGIKAPTIREQYSVESRSATSRQLSPEKVRAARVGMLTHFSSVFDQRDKLQLRVTIFDTHVKDNIARSRSKYMGTPPERHTYTNHRGFDIQGLEAELYYDAPHVFGSLNVAMMTSAYYGTIYDPNGPDIPVNDVPPPEVNMTLGYKLYEYNMRLGWKGKYAHKTEETAADIDPKAKFYTLYQPSKSYMINSLFWDWEPKAVTGLKLQLFVENLFDRQYQPYLSEGYPGMGRNFKVSATMKF